LDEQQRPFAVTENVGALTLLPNGLQQFEPIGSRGSKNFVLTPGDLAALTRRVSELPTRYDRVYVSSRVAAISLFADTNAVEFRNAAAFAEEITPVPEPTSFAPAGLAGAILVWFARKRLLVNLRSTRRRLQIAT
jgi:hypothetical protein